MPKETVLRNMIMLRMIPREPGTITADILRERLADQGFEKDLRTIQRDLNRSSIVFPIRDLKSPDSNAKCWCWAKNASIWDIPKMDTMTAMTFNLVESFLIKLIPRSMLGFMSNHFKRAEHILEKKGKSTWGRWGKKISIIPRGLQLIPPHIDPDVFEVVFSSVIEEKQLWLDYLKRDARKGKEYILNPLGLVFNQEVIYLVATKKELTTIQHFALHRIRSASMMDKEFEIPEGGFDFTSYVAEGAFKYPTDHDPIKLKVIFDGTIAGHLYESKLTRHQKLTPQKDGKVLLEAEIPNSSALKWWLLGFGDGVEVLEPPELRKEFAEIIENLSLKYGNGSKGQ